MCRPRPPGSRAGRRPCPGCRGREEPGWRRPSPPPAPEGSPASLRPWLGAEEKVRRQKWSETAVRLQHLSQEGFGTGGGARKDAGPVQCVGHGPVGAAAGRTSVKATSPLGLIYNWPPEEKPPGDVEKDAGGRGGDEGQDKGQAGH